MKCTRSRAAASAARGEDQSLLSTKGSTTAGGSSKRTSNPMPYSGSQGSARRVSAGGKAKCSGP